jgi:hypothetical protein
LIGILPTRCLVPFALLALVASATLADDPPALESLPGEQHVAASLADPVSRADTLLTMLAVYRLHERLRAATTFSAAPVVTAFSEDRTWLDRLSVRYGGAVQHSSVIDPSAWLVQRELEQHDLDADQLIEPLGPGIDAIMGQLFDRGDPGLAAAVLPEALLLIESRAVPTWRAVGELAESNEGVAAMLTTLAPAWFEPWEAAEPPAPTADRPPPLEHGLAGLTAVIEALIEPGPPDAMALKRMRYDLLLATPELDARQLGHAARLLHLATAIDGLRDRNYLAFAEALLWSVTDLLEHVAESPDDPLGSAQEAPTDPVLRADLQWSAAMAQLLPRLSTAFARQFSETDPRINAVLAAAYDLVVSIQSGSMDATQYRTLRDEMADAVAQIGLMIPDLDFYIGQPVRRELSEEIDICISIAANRDDNGDYTLSREQFDACLKSLVELADSVVREAELAGDRDGPFGTDQLRRELALTPWQRINYTMGFLSDEFGVACAVDERLPNPLEWSVLATLVTWFADRSPVYFQTPESEALVQRMRQIGVRMQQAISRQADCLAGTGAGVDDPIGRSLRVYRQGLDNLVSGIRNADLAFRAERLKPGADVVLTADSSQPTSYRMESLTIGPCDVEAACEMTGELEATRALIGLFPGEYLIAEQTGLGELEICYERMRWIDRRSEAVREDDDNVANYFGRLGFQLTGRYRDTASAEGEVSDVFAWSFVSPGEHHYLFGPATEEVLEDECPMEWVGSKVVTMMPDEGGFQVVPRRLTYLSAIRTRPSQVMSANWSRGSEWRDWFVTGIGVKPVEVAASGDIAARVDQHLEELYLAERVSLYLDLLASGGHRGEGLSLNDLVGQLSTYKRLIANILFLYYPDAYLYSDRFRAAFHGTGGLLDEAGIQRFRENNVPVESIGELGTTRADRFAQDWGAVPDPVRRTGSVALPVAYAMLRLNEIHRRFFALPEPVLVPESSVPGEPTAMPAKAAADSPPDADD